MKKRLLSILLVAAMVVAMVPAMIFATSAETSITDWTAEEIILMTADDYLAFHDQMLNGNKFVGQTVKLGADIDLGGTTVSKLGYTNVNSTVTRGNGKGFYGIFDGQYHTLSNVKLPAGNHSTGLFGSLLNTTDTAGAHVQIKNLKIDNLVAGDSKNYGMIYGYVDAKLTFENVYVNAIATGSWQYVGGYLGNVVKTSVITFTNCVFDGSLRYTWNMGSGFIAALGDNDTAPSTKPVFTNCVVTGSFTNNNAAQTSRCCFIGSAPYDTAKAVYTNCIQYNDYFQTGAGVASAVSPNYVGIGSGLTAKTPEGFTARNESYPIPTTLLPFYTDAINAAHTTQAAAELTVEYSKAQEKIEGDEISIRLIGAVNVNGAEDLQNYKAVGFDVVAIRQDNGAVWNNGATQIQKVYTGYLNGDETVSAEAAGGDYVFMYALEGIQANKGIVTFAIKSFYVDAEGTTVYTDMYVLDYNTNK